MNVLPAEDAGFLHLLCIPWPKLGLPSTAGVANSDLKPDYNMSCLTVILKAALSPTLPTTAPLLYETCMEILWRLAVNSDTSVPILSLLRDAKYKTLTSVLDIVACSPLPKDVSCKGMWG